jgi:hypothetical protein
MTIVSFDQYLLKYILQFYSRYKYFYIFYQKLGVRNQILNIAHLFNRLILACAASKKNSPICDENSDNIENLLAQLNEFGDPKLIKMDTGWWCFIEAPGAVSGTRLNVSSANQHTHPAQAIAECLDRAQASGLPQRMPDKPARQNF